MTENMLKCALYTAENGMIERFIIDKFIYSTGILMRSEIERMHSLNHNIIILFINNTRIYT